MKNLSILIVTLLMLIPIGVNACELHEDDEVHYTRTEIAAKNGYLDDFSVKSVKLNNEFVELSENCRELIFVTSNDIEDIEIIPNSSNMEVTIDPIYEEDSNKILEFRLGNGSGLYENCKVVIKDIEQNFDVLDIIGMISIIAIASLALFIKINKKKE